MFLVEKTQEFDKWIRKLSDRKAKARILLKLQRVAAGNLGDTNSVREGIHELRIHFGPGYRIYYRKLEESSSLVELRRHKVQILRKQSAFGINISRNEKYKI